MAITRPAKTNAAEIFTLDEIAAYLKVGKRTVYRLSAAKRIPAFKVGGTWRYSRADIDSWIKRQSLVGLESRRERAGSSKGRSNEGERK